MKIVYVFDPLCVFSYGFHPMIKQLQGYYDHIEMIPGGLWINENVKVVDDNVVQNLIKATDKVTQLSGQKFSEEFFLLLQSCPILDSFYGAKAFVLSKELGMNHLEFLSLMYEEVFIYGHHPSKLLTYESCVSILNGDPEAFITMFEDDQFNQLTEQEIEKTHQYGVSSYPTLLVIKDDIRHVYDLDYGDFEKLLNWIRNFE